MNTTYYFIIFHTGRTDEYYIGKVIEYRIFGFKIPFMTKVHYLDSRRDWISDAVINETFTEIQLIRNRRIWYKLRTSTKELCKESIDLHYANLVDKQNEIETQKAAAISREPAERYP